MIQIDDVVVSLDVFREKFLCDLGACKGERCIEGDAGAPVLFEEVEKLEEAYEVIEEEMTRARRQGHHRQARRSVYRRGRRFGDFDCERQGLCIHLLRREGQLLLRHRKGVSCRKGGFLQAGVLCALSDSCRRLWSL